MAQYYTYQNISPRRKEQDKGLKTSAPATPKKRAEQSTRAGVLTSTTSGVKTRWADPESKEENETRNPPNNNSEMDKGITTNLTTKEIGMGETKGMTETIETTATTAATATTATTAMTKIIRQTKLKEEEGPWDIRWPREEAKDSVPNGKAQQPIKCL